MQKIFSTLNDPQIRLLLFLLVFVQLVFVNKLVWDVHPPGMIMPVVRILAPESELVHARLSPYGPGLERELVELFAEHTGSHPVWVHMESAEPAWNELLNFRADILVGVGYKPSRTFMDALVAPVNAGPVFASHPIGVVHQRRYHAPTEMSDLCRRQLLLPESPLLEQTYSRIRDQFDCTTPAVFTNDGPLPVQFAAMEQTNARFILVDTGRFMLWEPFFSDFLLAEYLDTSIDYRWFWRSDRRALVQKLEDFWSIMLHNNELDRLHEKYQGFLPQKSDRFALMHFLDTMQREVPRYSKTILRAAEQFEIDPLLLVALIYHESRFDAEAVSRTGVRGIMQITQETAQKLGLDDPQDASQSILAGARYLRQIWDRLEHPEITVWDRWFLALSAYNQGLGHTWDAMDLAKNLGLKETSWNDVKSVFPLLSQQEYYSKARHGYTRGFEAVAHVEAIRYYYYILHGLFALDRPEGEHLSRLGLFDSLS
jgi:membrane-bound lytic murein transglycosylase F